MLQEMTCVHIGNVTDLKVICFCQISWAKVIACGEKQKVLNVSEINISADLLLIPINEQ